MTSLVVSLVILGGALAQGPHPQGVQHIVLDMNVEAVSLLGEKLYRTPAEGEALKKLEAALAEAEKHVAAQPDSPAVYAEQAKALGALWRYHDAAQAYTKVISLAPTDADAFARRATAFIALRLFDQAKNDFEHATAIAGDTGDNWLGLGIAHYLRQKFEEADKAFDEALSRPLPDEKKSVAGFWKNLTQRRLGKPGDSAAPRWEWMMPYVGGVDKLLAGDKEGALQTWHALIDNPNWPFLTNVVAEVEIAAIEGAKKMKVITE